jgi:uncharacterized protein YjbJ (UPF0337 family)
MKQLTELKGNWSQIKGKLKIKFAMLTDSDLLIIKGHQDEMFKRLQLKLGKTKEEVQKLLSEI